MLTSEANDFQRVLKFQNLLLGRHKRGHDLNLDNVINSGRLSVIPTLAV